MKERRSRVAKLTEGQFRGLCRRHLPWFSAALAPENPMILAAPAIFRAEGDAPTWYIKIFREDGDKIGAAMIHLLGHMAPELVEPWGYTFLGAGLLSDRPDFREAAILALERMGSKRAWVLLSEVIDAETDPRLALMTRRVMETIEKTHDHAFV